MTTRDFYIDVFKGSGKDWGLYNTIGTAAITKSLEIFNKLASGLEGFFPFSKDVFLSSRNFDGKTNDAGTPEEYVTGCTETTEMWRQRCINKWFHECGNILSKINTCKIDHESIHKIENFFNKIDAEFMEAIRDMSILDLSVEGYTIPESIPIDKQVDMMSYAKQCMQEMVRDIFREVKESLLRNNHCDHIQPTALLPGMVEQDIIQPLVQMDGSLNPIPITNDQDILKHFVIGDNVVIYDYLQQQSFLQLLKTIAQQLNQNDKAEKVSKPTRFGFEQFISPVQFRAVRLDDNNCFVPYTDPSFMAIETTADGLVKLIKDNKAA